MNRFLFVLFVIVIFSVDSAAEVNTIICPKGYLYVVPDNKCIKRNPTFAFMEALIVLSPSTADVVIDYFQAKSCWEKSVYDYSPEEITQIIENNATFSHLLSLNNICYNK